MEKKSFEEMSADELKKELKYYQDCLEDEEETYNFSMVKSSVHIGSQQVTAMKEEFLECCRDYREKISKIEELLKEK